MDKFKGTSRPWNISVGIPEIYINSQSGEVCRIEMRNESGFSESQFEDAKVIAAAPLMLEALQSLVFLHACEQEGLSSGQPSLSDWIAAVIMLKQPSTKR